MIGSIARRAFPLVAALFVACSIVQVFLAGLGVFDDPAAFITHRDFGYMFGLLVFVLLILALVGRLPRALIGGNALLVILFILQSVSVAVRADMPAVAALHPLNGFAILALGAMLTRASWRIQGAEQLRF